MSFNPQLKGVGETKWTGNSLYFATEAEALAYAEDLQGRWMGCQAGAQNRRAFETDEPVNSEWTNGRLTQLNERPPPPLTATR
jgi:hypothetical protein